MAKIGLVTSGNNSRAKCDLLSNNCTGSSLSMQYYSLDLTILLIV